jgi:hypothetical protein
VIDRLTLAARVDEVYDWAGVRVRDLVRSRHGTTVSVLDVGAGRGKYRLLLHDYPAVDAVEVWSPTVVDEDLWGLYRSVYVDDVHDLVTSSRWDDVWYDVVIMGDVLEHMTVERAATTLARLDQRSTDVIVVVPYMYPQGEEDGNIYQHHVQDDLTPELMASRYPTLRLLALETRDRRPFKGIYLRSNV